MESSIKEFAHLQIPLEDVLKATNNFDDRKIIGKGEFGKVYKGHLMQSGELIKIAARRLDGKRRQGYIEFWNEISVLSNLKHENLVSIIGFCDEKDEKIIINSYNANGSLSKHLSNPTLTWIQRLNICIGIARALSYIHKEDGRNYCVIHRNINSSTILLDDKFEAKLSGFEYSIKYSVYQMNDVLLGEAIGTAGYMDPSIEKIGGVTHKSDIYSFGVVLWEILCGRKAYIPNEDEDNRYLASLARFHYGKQTLDDIIHPDLRNQMALKSVNRFAAAAYYCLKDDQVRRPDMNNIVHELENTLELENLKKNLEYLKIQLTDLKIRLSDIMLATDNFSSSYLIDNTEYYNSYRAELDHFDKVNPSSIEGKNKGHLPKRWNTVVLRRFHPRKDNEGEGVFVTELEMLTTCKHENIVTLLGFCDEGSEMILVIEYVSNGSLFDYLANIKDRRILSWGKFFKICLDVAHALKYLHYEMEDQKTIINRNINSSNIVLDENWGAKIDDFGYSVYLPLNQDDDALHLNHIAGTRLYMDPEYRKTKRLKRESDVYSFGVVLLEVLFGRVANDSIFLDESYQGLAHTARRCIDDGLMEDMVDSMIKEVIGLNKDSIDKFVEIAYKCVAQTQDQRPTMNVVVKELEQVVFLQEEQVQRPNKDHIFDEFEKSIELELIDKTLEEGVTQPNLDRIMDEVDNTMEQKLMHENTKKNREYLEIELTNLKIRLSDIMLASDNFSSAYLIGNTTDYNSYRVELDHFDNVNPSSVEGKNIGHLPKRRNNVVLKRYHPREDNEGERAFFTELEILTTCKHENIVTLLGFCDEGSEMIIVVEYVFNGYLYDYLINIKDMHILTWGKRLKICLDVANALKYLHYEMEDQKTIIMRDIRCDYIVLDENWGAKIVDFGLSVYLPPNQDDDALIYKFYVGTEYYVDPEYKMMGKLKRESDVYSFGVILLEVLCGRVAYDDIYLEESDQGLAHVARRCINEGQIEEMVDPIIKEESGLNKHSLYKFIEIAYKCVAQTQDQRPTMNVVIKELEQAVFFQEEQVQRPNKDHIFDEFEKLAELKLTDKTLEEGVTQPNLERIMDEVDKTMELKLMHENIANKLEHLKIPLSEIMLATNNFYKEYYTRTPLYYLTYKAELDHYGKLNRPSIEGKNNDELPKRRKTVCINRLIHRKDGLNEKVFFTDIEMLSSCKHRNIVTLLGFCNEASEMILVIEHTSGEYLWNYLENIKEKPIFTWARRLKICLDVAHGIKYLHYDMEDQKAIVNRAISSTNILLDENLVPKIRFFGYSVFLSPKQDHEVLRLNNFGEMNAYTDPEFLKTGNLQRVSDVYDFGLVLFEVLFGGSVYDAVYDQDGEKWLASVARKGFHEGTLMEMIDPMINDRGDDYSFALNRGPNKNSLDTFIKIAYECLAETQDQRPTMEVVVKELEKALIFHENNKDDPRISLEDIMKATRNFDDDNRLGTGGFGNVYEGKLPKGDGFDTIVAKRLDIRRGQGEQQFRNELQILFKYKHANVIRLVGYCDEKDEKVIVYEYASRGSLDRYLNDPRLTWVKRLNVCIDVASALEFLHGGVSTKAAVIHRDIKTENILLNDEWKAKLGDYGLSLISAVNQETGYVIDRACGTLGYVDPVYLKSGFLTMESDIYSFGVVLFEILCGRSTFAIHKHEGQHLPSFIKQRFEQGNHEEEVFKAIKAQIAPKALNEFQTIAYQCLHDVREQRPTAKQVLKQLKKALEFQVSKRD